MQHFDLDLIQNVAESLGITAGQLIMGIIGTSLAIVAGVAAKVTWKVTKFTTLLSYYATRASYKWLTKRPQVSPVCEAVLKELDSSSMTWEAPCDANKQFGKLESKKLVGYCKYNSTTFDRFMSVKGSSDSGKCKSILPVLSAWEQKLVQDKARDTVIRLQEKSLDYDKMEILDDLEKEIPDTSAWGIPAPNRVCG
jgi:hypothetical protein